MSSWLLRITFRIEGGTCLSTKCLQRSLAQMPNGCLGSWPEKGTPAEAVRICTDLLSAQGGLGERSQRSTCARHSRLLLAATAAAVHQPHGHLAQTEHACSMFNPGDLYGDTFQLLGFIESGATATCFVDVHRVFPA